LRQNPQGLENEIMRMFSVVALRLFFTGLVVCSTIQNGLGRERGPRVEVFCPAPPIAVKLAEQRVLVYELHITNFEVVPLTLKRVEIFADAEKKEPLKVWEGDVLSAAMMEIGSNMGMAGSMETRSTGSSQTIDPGRRAVVFMWVALRLDARLPNSLRHRMVFVGGEPEKAAGSASESTLEDFPVPVSHDSALLLGLPFDGGVWLAGSAPANDSDHRRSLMAIDGHVHDAQRFAIDWMKVGPNGDSHHGTSQNEDFWGYGEPVLAVADGEITQVVDGIPENTPRVLPQPVTLDNIAGNYVILRIAANRYVTYAHLQTGSIKVRLGDHVARGTVIARLGNTGQATAPHLHFQVTDANSVLQSEGVPFIFAKFTDLGPGSDYELDKHQSIPRTDSIPGKDEVVEFTAAKK
jgi:hypothetical protein